MPSNTDPETLVSSAAWRNKVIDFLRKNLYLVLVFFIVFLPILIILFNRFPSSLNKINPLPVSTSSSTTIATPILCPTSKELCQSGKDVKITNDTNGIGIDLTKGSPIYAAFDGQLMTGVITNKSGQGFLVLSLSNPQLGKQAVYWYKGTEGKPGMVKKGDILATSSGEIIPSTENNKFVFMLFDSTNGKSISAKPEDFK